MDTQQSPGAQAAVLWIQAQWHRAQSRDYLNNSTASMYQHEHAAAALEAQAAQLTREDMTA